MRRIFSVALAASLFTVPAGWSRDRGWDANHDSLQGDPPDPRGDPGGDNPGKCGSPVEVASGSFVYSVPILTIAGAGPAISIGLNYHSLDLRRGPFGKGWTMPYDQRIIETTDGVRRTAICADSNGRREIYVRNSDGSFQSPAHLRTILTKTAAGEFVLSEPDGASRRYNKDGQLSAVTDRNGNSLTLLYDSSGFLISITDASARTVTFAKGADGRVASLTDPAARTFRFAYDTRGNLASITDPLSGVVNFRYDSWDNLTSIIDPRGNSQVAVSYDPTDNNKVSTLRIGDETWSYYYYPSLNQTAKYDSNSDSWTFTYDANGSITRIDAPNGFRETFLYDANYNLIEHTDRNGNKTKFTYDNRGNPLTVTDAENNARVTTWHPTFSKPLTVQDPLGRVTRFEYDAKGNLTKITNADNRVTSFEYNARGLLTKSTDPLGKVSTFEYDQYGNLTRSTDPLGNQRTATYGILGQTLTSRDAENRVTTFVYDQNLRVKETVNAASGRSVFDYDAAGNTVAITLPNNAKSTFEYDTRNRLRRSVNPLGETSSFTYNSKGQLASQTTPRFSFISYTYDEMARLYRKTRPEGTTTYLYDPVGNLTSVSNSTATVSYTYDKIYRVRSTSMSTGFGMPPTTVAYTYDGNNNRKTMTDPSGGVFAYDYDILNRLTRITNPFSEVFTFAYDAASRRASQSGPGGVGRTYSYDDLGRLTNLAYTGGPALGFGYTYDRVGNRLTAQEPAGLHSYTYDPLYQLTAATHPAGNPAESYTYDPLGNRVTSHLSATHTVDAANRLKADARFDYTYDAAGNLTQRRERSTGTTAAYTYDSENRLTRVVSGATTVQFRYDPLGRRIEKAVGAATTRWVYDGNSLLSELNGSVVAAQMTNGLEIDEVLAVRQGNSSTWLDIDGQGSVFRARTSSAVATFIYDSFGRPIASTGNAPILRRFHSREFDTETSLYYYRARYYDPTAGRFMSEDPIGFAAEDNFYVFVGNNPLAYRDPLGTDKIKICIDKGTFELSDDKGTSLMSTSAYPGCESTPTKVGRFRAGSWQRDKKNNEYSNTRTPYSDRWLGWTSGYGPWFLPINEENGTYTTRGIHGTPFYNVLVGACSHGCVRLSNSDISRLHDLLPKPAGTPIEIVATCP